MKQENEETLDEVLEKSFDDALCYGQERAMGDYSACYRYNNTFKDFLEEYKPRIIQAVKRELVEGEGQ